MDVNVDLDLDLDANVDADVVAVVLLDAAAGGSCRRRGMFGFQRLDVYRASTQFLGLTSKLVARIPMTVFSQADLNQARELLERVVSMLTGLIRP